MRRSQGRAPGSSLAVLGLAGQFLFPTTGTSTHGKAILLAIDDASLPLKKNLCYYLTKPSVRREPVLTPSRDDPNAPDYLAAHFYGTVLFDEGKFRMWYYPCHLGRNPDWDPGLRAQAERWKDDVIPGPLCYAESTDGITWTKPNVGQLLFKGNRDNNALDLPSALTADACVIRDDDPDPARQYKLAFWTQYDPWDYPTMRIATSADGLRWDAAPEPPIEAFLEHASFYKHNGLYFANSQAFLPGESGRDRGRQGAVWVSPDFDHWLQECGESFALPYAPGPKRDEVHLGVGAASLGNVLVGLYCIWHNEADFGEISGDLGLVVSNDGIAFREPVKGHVWLAAEDPPVTPAPGKQHPTVLCQANGILNVGDETRIYHGRWRNAPYGGDAPPEDYYAEVALATLPRDRWGALGLVPNATEGSVWSCPVTLPESGCQVSLNAEGADGMAVEVADERFGLLPEFSGDKAGVASGANGLDLPVTWPEGDIDDLAGRTVRFRVRVQQTGDTPARLYCVYLQAPANAAALKTADHRAKEFPVGVGKRTLTAKVLSPPKDRLAEHPALLLTFAGDRDSSLLQAPYGLPAQYFLAHGHRAASLTLPSHGDRIDALGEGITGWRNALVAGEDPFEAFVDDTRALIDECIRRGWAQPGRIAVCGTSRGGYMALRLLAADERIAAGAGFAPVTDWRQLDEFAADRERDDVAGLRLTEFVGGMAGRDVFVAISGSDARVGTTSCRDFAESFRQAERRAGIESSRLWYTETDGEGHSLADPWYEIGEELLLRAATRE